MVPESNMVGESLGFGLHLDSGRWSKSLEVIDTKRYVRSGALP